MELRPVLPGTVVRAAGQENVRVRLRRFADGYQGYDVPPGQSEFAPNESVVNILRGI